jgi:hypothetical protein
MPGCEGGKACEAELITNLRDALSGLGVSRKTAGRIERLCRVCECENIAINSSPAGEEARRTLFLASAEAGVGNVLSMREAAEHGGGILCMVNPRKGRLWRELCRKIAEEHDGMGMESRDLMIIFTDKGLNKQHIRV